MKASFIFASAASLVILYMSLFIYQWPLSSGLRAIVLANLSVGGTLWLITTLESFPWVKKTFLKGALLTWSFALLCATTPVVLGVPELRSPKLLILFFLPLAFSSGFIFPLFGLIRDRVVAKHQRLQRLRNKQKVVHH